MKFDRLGWIVAAALAGGMVGMGFQGPTEKMGSVDMAKVFNESDVAKRQTDVLHTLGATRVAILEFLQQNIHMKSDDARKFKDLSLKESPTAVEKADLERVKTEAQTNESACSTLMTKPGPSAAEITQIDLLNKQKEANQTLLQSWNDEFTKEVDQKRQTLHSDTMQKVRDAVAQVAKKQGYSMVFAQEVVPFSVNDLTPDALNAMNSGKK